MNEKLNYYVICPDCGREIEAMPFRRGNNEGSCAATGRTPVQYGEEYCENCGFPIALSNLTPVKQEHVFFAPGRLNLIGEHTDYNGGYVFPCSISLGTYGAIRKRKDEIAKFTSKNIGLTVETDINKIIYDPAHGWANYPKAVAAELTKMGCRLGGFDLYVDGNLPSGAGLSSSASLELLTCTALNDIFGLGLSLIEMAQLCQRAENGFVGVNCGIMDQFACGLGRKNQVILLNCKTLNYEFVPLTMEGYKLIISNTNKQRGLENSKYNERRAECEQALASLRTKLPIEALCDITPALFEEHKHVIKDEVILKRATHIIYENARVLAAVDTLSKNDLFAFGALMNESHISLRDLYEVTGTELDTLAEAAWETDGVLGSRMTGAGFGGCTVSLVAESETTSFIKKVGEIYKQKTGLNADFYIAETGTGAGRIASS